MKPMSAPRFMFVVLGSAGVYMTLFPDAVHSPIFWGEFVAIVAAVGVINARVAASYRARMAPPDDPRWKPSAEPQRVGATCGVCDQRIVVERQAADCPGCGTPFHRSCLGAHVVEHAEAPVGAYRARG